MVVEFPILGKATIRNIETIFILRNAERGPEPNAGVRGHCGRKHIWVLIFFGSFLDQAKKEQIVQRSDLVDVWESEATKPLHYERPALCETLGKARWIKACVMLALDGAMAFARPALLMLWRVG